MEALNRLGYSLVFAPQNLHGGNGRYTSALEVKGIEVVLKPEATSVWGFLEGRGREFQVVLIIGFETAGHLSAAVRRFCPFARVHLDLGSDDLTVDEAELSQLLSLIHI